MKVLLIEDEDHKRRELSRCLETCFPGEIDFEHVDSVHSAYWSVSACEFGLIVLDMALPTFSGDGGASQRGIDQAQGGIEVLRALKERGVCARVVIVTQYPEVDVGGQRMELGSAVAALAMRYGQDILGGIIYKYNSAAWSKKLKAILKGVL